MFQNLLKDVVKLKFFKIPSPVLTNLSPAVIVPSPALENPSAGLILPFPALTNPLPVDKFPNQEAPKVPNNIPNAPPFCSFTPFLIVFVTPFNKIFESSKS